MIRLYPSRLPGAPLEVHAHGDTTLDAWLRANVSGYPAGGPQPIEAALDGRALPFEAWATTTLAAGSDVRLYPVPRDPGTLSLIATGVSLAFQVYSYLSNRGQRSNNRQGTQLDLNPATANTARLGDVIAEIMGRVRRYPDYLVQPVSRFVDGRTYRTTMFVCVGRGSYTLPVGGMRIGATPVSAFGDDVSLDIYPPGADVSGDARSENWFNSTEVSATNSGTAGLDLSDTADTETSINADSITVSGNVLSLNNATVTDEDGNEKPATALPPGWVVGAVLTLKASATFTASNDGLYSAISGAAVDELGPFVGMPVLVTYNEADYALFVASYAAGTPAVPGTGGTAATLRGSAPVAGYDFTGAPETFSITWKGTTYGVTLDANYVTIGILLQAITDQLSGSGLVATQAGNVVTIGEAGSPFAGGTITHSSLPAAVFGAAPVASAGIATSGGSPAVPPRVTLAYDSATGTAFGGLPPGPVALAIGRGGSEYRIASVSGLSLTVQRLTESGVVDTSWPGWVTRTATEYQATGLQEGESWLGPFLVCPDGEATDAFEYDFNFGSGLIWYTSKGKRRKFTVTLRVAWRVYGSGAPWNVRSHTYTDTTEDGIGFTERVNLGAPAQIEVRVRRVTARGGSSARDAVYWQGLRSRLSQRPSRYEGLTTIGLTITTGTKLGAQSDRRFNVLATRQYAEGTPRTISGAMYHVLKSLGTPDEEIDRDTIDALEADVWTPRSEFFDYSADKAGMSALDVLKLITQAGMGYFLRSGGLNSAGREGIKSWVGGVTPNRMLEELQTAFVAPGEDDFDGVDVTYIDEVTGAAETVECRLPGGDTPRKVEAFTLDGVGNRTRAWRFGMRRLMKHQGQRLTHTCTTELMAQVYQYGDRIKLTDDIPGSTTISAMIEGASLAGGRITIRVGERLDWSLPEPRCLIRSQDGNLSGVINPTRVDYNTLSIAAVDLPNGYGFSTWIMDDPIIDPPELIFCDSTQVGYDAVVDEIAPGQDNSCELTALQYDPAFYQYDDANAP